jgi:putative RecB family exonuclease
MAAAPRVEGLYTSVSQMKCWLRCPRQFELKYVRGVTPAFVPVAFAFGTAIHAALGAYYGEQKISGTPLRLDRVLDVFREAWARQVEGNIPLQEDEDEEFVPNLLVDKGVSMLHAFHESASQRPVEVEDVEKKFEIEIFDPDTGEVLEEKLVGVIDLVAVETGRRVIWEHKTSARKYGEDQLRWDQQVCAYAMACRELGLGEVGIKFQILTKTKVPAIQIAEVTRTPADEDDFLRTVRGVLKAIDAGVSFPIRGWQCHGCPYQGPCGQRSRS